MGELTLQVSYLVPFIWSRCKGCLAGFPVITGKYSYVACLKVAMWFVLVLSGLIMLWFPRYLRIQNLFKHLR